MAILAVLHALFTLVHPARDERPAEHRTPAGPAVRTDDDELLAVATAMGVVRDLTADAAASALAGAR